MEGHVHTSCNKKSAIHKKRPLPCLHPPRGPPSENHGYSFVFPNATPLTPRTNKHGWVAPPCLGLRLVAWRNSCLTAQQHLPPRVRARDKKKRTGTKKKTETGQNKQTRGGQNKKNAFGTKKTQTGQKKDIWDKIKKDICNKIKKMTNGTKKTWVRKCGVDGREGPNPEKVGPRRVGPRRVGPPGWGPEGWGAQNFALFFSFSHSHFHSFFLSLGIFSCLFFSLRVSSRVFFPLSGGLLVECWWCFGRSGPQMCLFSLTSCRVEAPGGLQAARVSQDNLRAKTSTFEVPTDQNTTKIPREDPQREEKRHEKTPGERKKDTRRSPERKKKMKMGVGEGKKKARNFGRFGGGARGPWEHANFGPTHTADTHSRHTHTADTHTTTHNNTQQHTQQHTTTHTTTHPPNHTPPTPTHKHTHTPITHTHFVFFVLSSVF